MFIKKIVKHVVVAFCICSTMQAMENTLPFEIKKFEESARTSGDAVAMLQLGDFYANRELDYKIAVGWLLAYGVRSIQDTSLLSGNGLKRLNDLQNKMENLAAKNGSLKNYYIEKETEYVSEFELRLNEIRILTKENKLENPDWIDRFLKQNESLNFIEPSLWQAKRIAALDNIQQMLLPGFAKK